MRRRDAHAEFSSASVEKLIARWLENVPTPTPRAKPRSQHRAGCSTCCISSLLHLLHEDKKKLQPNLFLFPSLYSFGKNKWEQIGTLSTTRQTPWNQTLLNDSNTSFVRPCPCLCAQVTGRLCRTRTLSFTSGFFFFLRNRGQTRFVCSSSCSPCEKQLPSIHFKGPRTHQSFMRHIYIL